MKRFLAVILSAILLLSLCACSKEEPDKEVPAKDTKVETEAEDTKEETTEDESSEDESDSEEKDEEVASSEALPEVKGVAGDMDFELVGMDITKAYDDCSAIRFWFMVTNNSKSLRFPNYIVGWDGIVCTQNGETLIGTSVMDEQLEDTIAGCDLLPGTTVLYTEKYEMVNDTDVINVAFKLGDTECTCDVDPATFTSVIPEPFTWAPVTSSDWFQPVSDEVDLSGVHIKVVGCEVIKGTPWIGDEEFDCVRVTYEATNSTGADTSVGGYFDVLQDGVELQLGVPTSEYAIDTDVDLTAPVADGETIQYSLTYMLYNSESPVMVVYDDFSAVYGINFDVK